VALIHEIDCIGDVEVDVNDINMPGDKNTIYKLLDKIMLLEVTYS